MKKTIQALTLITTSLFTAAYAAEEASSSLSGTLAFTSNYVSRGVSQTNNLPAVQGGLTYSLPYNFYLNGWGSNAKFNDTAVYLEFDAMAGWTKSFFDDDFNIDANVIRYLYPSASELAYNEITARFTYRWLFLYMAYSENAFNLKGTGTYYNVGINYDLPESYLKDVSIKAAVGRYVLEETVGNSYTDYLLAVNKKIGSYTLTLQWTDTNGKFNVFPYDTSLITGSVTYAF